MTSHYIIRHERFVTVSGLKRKINSVLRDGAEEEVEKRTMLLTVANLDYHDIETNSPYVIQTGLLISDPITL